MTSLWLPIIVTTLIFVTATDRHKESPLWLFLMVINSTIVTSRNSHNGALWLFLIVGLESHIFAKYDCCVTVFGSHKNLVTCIFMTPTCHCFWQSQIAYSSIVIIVKSSYYNHINVPRVVTNLILSFEAKEFCMSMA